MGKERIITQTRHRRNSIGITVAGLPICRMLRVMHILSLMAAVETRAPPTSDTATRGGNHKLALHLLKRTPTCGGRLSARPGRKTHLHTDGRCGNASAAPTSDTATCGANHWPCRCLSQTIHLSRLRHVDSMFTVQFTASFCKTISAACCTAAQLPLLCAYNNLTAHTHVKRLLLTGIYKIRGLAAKKGKQPL